MYVMSFFRKSLFVCSLLVSVALPALALAQSPTPATQQATVLATVNIQNAKITSQEGNIFHISFDLTNRIIPQTGVMYGVMLVSATAQGQSIADQYIFPGSVDLAEHSSVHKDIVYTAPSSLSGTYHLVLTSKNASGFPFAVDDLGSTTLKASGGLQIQTDSCYIQVAGKDTKYALTQGVDIAPTENLVLTCKATNHGSGALSVTPTYQTHYRTVYGVVVEQTGGTTTSIVFKAGETKAITLTLPKAIKPQAYDVLVTMIGGNISSNPVDIHYVIQGNSATIQNLSLDKNYFASGDTAQLSFLWSPSADMFPGSRAHGNAAPSIPQGMTISVTMVDANNTACIAPLNQSVPAQPNAKVALPLIHDCRNPHLSLDLKDASGTVLAHQELVLSSGTDVSSTKSFLLFVLLGAVLAALVLFFATKRRA